MEEALRLAEKLKTKIKAKETDKAIELNKKLESLIDAYRRDC